MSVTESAGCFWVLLGAQRLCFHFVNAHDAHNLFTTHPLFSFTLPCTTAMITCMILAIQRAGLLCWLVLSDLTLRLLFRWRPVLGL